jgi:hypothetical protein
MKHSRILSTFIALVSAGWVAPLFIACDLYASYITKEFLPQVQGHPLLTSFPDLQAATSLVHIALVWLGVVVASWAYWILSRSRVSGSK